MSVEKFISSLIMSPATAIGHRMKNELEQELR